MRQDNGPILVTGAAGQLGAVGRAVTSLLLDCGLSVRHGPSRGRARRGLASRWRRGRQRTIEYRKAARGAFSGALSRRTGRFEIADAGTLFLDDEIGDIPRESQPKLLRALQEQEFERLGGTQTTRVNARIVAATSRDARNFQTFRFTLN